MSEKRHGGARQGAGRKPGAINKATAQARAEAEATGILPLAYMLARMRDESAERAARDDMAKAAAPYIHAKLSSVEAKVDVEGHLDITQIELIGG